jgi:branched-subunit amino acid transport protein
MMLAATALPDGMWGYLVLLGMALVFHEPWRWLGLVLGRSLQVDSAVFSWVRAVATALIAALIMRLVLFPAGGLAALSPGLRVGAFGVGLAVFVLGGRNMALGVIVGAVALVLGGLLIG